MITLRHSVAISTAVVPLVLVTACNSDPTEPQGQPVILQVDVQLPAGGAP